MFRFPSVTLRYGVLVAFLASVGVLTACTAPIAPQLTRSPYLTDLVGRSVAVNWATDTSNTVAGASWGAVDAMGGCTPTNVVAAARTSITVGTTSEYQWKATLSLPASGRYCYRVALGSTDLLGGDPSPIFTTQVPRGSTAPVLVRRAGRLGSDRRRGRQRRHHQVVGAVGPLGGTLRGVGGRQRLPRGQPDQQRGSEAARRRHQCRVRSGVLAVGGQQPADVHRAGQPRHPVRVGDAQHRADQLAPGQRGGDLGWPVPCARRTAA